MSHCCLDLMTSGMQFPMNRTVARKQQRRVSLKSSTDVAQPCCSWYFWIWAILCHLSSGPRLSLFIPSANTERQDTQEMLHATDSLVLCMCCLELSPFWDCGNYHLMWQQWLYGGSATHREMVSSQPVQKHRWIKVESNSTCPLQGRTEFLPLLKYMIEK